VNERLVTKGFWALGTYRECLFMISHRKKRILLELPAADDRVWKPVSKNRFL